MLLDPEVSVKLKLPKNSFSLHVQSMTPELNGKIGRATVRLGEDSENFYIYIEAPDMGSIRPAISSINRMLLLVSRVNREVR